MAKRSRDEVTAVAVIWPQDGIYKDRGPTRAHKYWRITWRGPCASFSADVVYLIREQAERMARECGAQQIEYTEARP